MKIHLPHAPLRNRLSADFHNRIAVPRDLANEPGDSMHRGLSLGLVTATCMLLPLTASAQMGMRSSPTMRGVWNPVVGAGGTYELTKKDGTKTSMEMAIVGKESVGGKDGYWFEVTIADSPMGTLIMKSLLVRDDQDMVSS